MTQSSQLVTNTVVPDDRLFIQARQRSSWSMKDKQGITILESPLLSQIPGLVHAFTTRAGGSSPAPLNSFNLGRHWEGTESKDDAMHNRQRLCEALEVDFTKLCTPGQEHTTIVRWIGHQVEAGQGPGKLQGIDGLATGIKQIPLLLSFADCVPIILAVPEPRAIAVIHAGWRGTASSIVKEAVSLLRKQTGCAASHIKAAIGPCIGPCCFETDLDVAEQLKASLPWQDLQTHHIKLSKAFPDLKYINALQLLEVGIEDLDISDFCTACANHIFYSHRQSKGKTGRQGALACLV